MKAKAKETYHKITTGVKREQWLQTSQLNIHTKHHRPNKVESTRIAQKGVKMDITE